jgi:uncharacterized membrane protein YkvA (DUF1232 family)
MKIDSSVKYTKKSILSWIIMAIAVIYDISPIDIIPDIPIVGWVDDFFVTITAILNLVQKSLESSNAYLAKITKIAKWVMILLGAIVIVLILLLGSWVVSLCTK